MNQAVLDGGFTNDTKAPKLLLTDTTVPPDHFFMGPFHAIYYLHIFYILPNFSFKLFFALDL